MKDSVGHTFWSGYNYIYPVIGSMRAIRKEGSDLLRDLEVTIWWLLMQPLKSSRW